MEKEIIAFRAEDKQGEKKYRKCCYVAVALLFSFMQLTGMLLLWRPLLPLQSGMFFLITSMVVAVLTIFAQQNKTLEFILPFFCLFAAFILLFFRMETVIQGMLGIGNNIIGSMNERFNTYLPLYYFPESEQESIAWAMLVLGILFGLFSGYAIWRRWLGPITVEIFFIMAAGCLLQEKASCLAIILLVAVWLGIWSGNKKNVNHGWRTGFCLCAGTILIGGVLSFCFLEYKPNEQVANIKKQIETNIHRWRFGEDNLPEGDLCRAGHLFDEEKSDEKEKVLLELSFSEAEEMYLKGFVGTEYDGQCWKKLSNDAYTGKQQGMLDWLEINGYKPTFPYASQQDAEKDKYKVQTVTVKNKGADRYYVYVPETAGTVTADYTVQQDWQLCSDGFFGVHNYQFENLSLPFQKLWEAPAWMEDGGTKGKEQYIQAEAVYRSFVYENYLTVGDDLKEKIQNLFFSGSSWTRNVEGQKSNLYNATTRIRVMLKSLAQYVPQTEEMPKGEDFVSWFLEEHKEGNAVHFATTAVLAYRVLGIPARYAEGYYLNKELADTLLKEGADSCNLTQKNGHAWVEIYIDGIGWSPVEVTPGFYQEVYNPDYLIDMQEEEIEKMDRGAQVEADEIMPGREKKKEPLIMPEFPWNFFGVFLLITLIFLGIGLLLEIQRGIRIGIQRRKRKNYPDIEAALSYRKMCRILESAGIKDGFGFPYTLTERICERFTSVKEEEYLRFIQIIQKDIFGHKILFANEKRVMDVFIEKLRGDLYSHASILKKLLYRYVYCH